MSTADGRDAESTRHWFLDTPEAQVMSAARERELLLELAECRRGLLRATRRGDGSGWDLSRPDAEFRRTVRGLTDGRDEPHDPGDDHGSVAELARRYEEIRGALAMANSRLVAYIARRYLNRGLATADLLQEGFCGLLEAIDRFDAVNTTRLATYASWWIRQAIQRAIADGSYPVRLSPRQLRRLARALPRGAGSDGSEGPTRPGGRLGPWVDRPSADGESSATWHELAAIRPRVSLDAVSRFDGTTPMAELLAFLPDADREVEERGESIEALLSALRPREQLVVKLRYGLDGNARHSLSQIGAVLAVSKERVRQIQDRALRRLRDAATATATAPGRRPV